LIKINFRFSIKIPNAITLTHQYKHGRKGPLKPNPHVFLQGYWNAIVDPKDGELHNLKNMINSLLTKEVMVTLNVNNHFEGSAPMTIDRFLQLFGVPFI